MKQTQKGKGGAKSASPSKKAPGTTVRKRKAPPPSLLDVVAPLNAEVPGTSDSPMLIDDVAMLGEVIRTRTMSLWEYINILVHPSNRDPVDHAGDIDWFMSPPKGVPLSPMAFMDFAVIELPEGIRLKSPSGVDIPGNLFRVNAITRSFILRRRFTERALRSYMVTVHVFVPKDAEEAEFYPLMFDAPYSIKPPAARALMLMNYLGIPCISTYLRKGARITSALELAGHANLHERRRPQLARLKATMLDWAGEIALVDSLWLTSDKFPAAVLAGVLTALRVNPDLTSRLVRLVMAPSNTEGTNESEQRAAAAFNAAIQEWTALKKTLGGPLSSKQLAGLWVAAFKMAANPKSRGRTVEPDDFEAFREEAEQVKAK